MIRPDLEGHFNLPLNASRTKYRAIVVTMTPSAVPLERAAIARLATTVA